MWLQNVCSLGCVGWGKLDRAKHACATVRLLMGLNQGGYFTPAVLGAPMWGN